MHCSGYVPRQASSFVHQVCSYKALYPVRVTVQSALYFTPWQTCSFILTPWQTCSFILTPWQTCSFILHPLADLFLYTSPPGRPVPLYFTPWQTCSFILHPLADLFLYTSPPGRPVPLYFTPWQTCSFILHPLADLYSFIQLSELMQLGVITRTCPTSTPMYLRTYIYQPAHTSGMG